MVRFLQNYASLFNSFAVAEVAWLFLKRILNRKTANINVKKKQFIC